MRRVKRKVLGSISGKDILQQGTQNFLKINDHQTFGWSENSMFIFIKDTKASILFLEPSIDWYN